MEKNEKSNQRTKMDDWESDRFEFSGSYSFKRRINGQPRRGSAPKPLLTTMEIEVSSSGKLFCIEGLSSFLREDDK